MERIKQPTTSELSGGTINETLDLIQIKLGKIGMNSAEQSMAVLTDLDLVYEKIQELEGGQSRKTLETQFEASLAVLNKEAARFLRELGGVHVLVQAREKNKPSQDRVWWYLDVALAKRHTASLRRTLITTGVILVILIALGWLYNRFLAPDPQVAARYAAEQAAQDQMMSGDYEKALQEVETGLKGSPDDTSLLILKGVLLDSMGKSAEAQQIFAMVQGGGIAQDQFYMTRGQIYLMANQVDKALADAQQAVQISPKSPQAFLLLGQVYETKQDNQNAIDQYNTAYALADAAKQYELAALARTRMAMLMQVMGSQMNFPGTELTPSPTP